MSFLFVDRILAVEPGKYIRGVKHVTPHDEYLMPGPDGKPILFTSVIGETLGQLGAWNAMQQYDFALRPVAGLVSSVQFLKNVTIGESLLLETFIDSLDDKAVQYHSVASSNGEPVLKIDSAVGPMVETEQFIAKEVARDQFHAIYQPGEWQELEPASKTLYPEPFNYSCFYAFDRILDWQPGSTAVAEKLVTGQAAFFADHFPRKPVLPLTLLLESKLDLARRFLPTIYGDDASQFRAAGLKKVKMKSFVPPGSVLRCKMTTLSQSEDRAVFTFRSEVNNEVVCLAQAQFERI